MLTDRLRLFLAPAAIGLALAAGAAPAAAYTDVYVFGDSLSDNGNLYDLTGGMVPPSAYYWNGRFSNGPVAVEVLASSLGATLHDYAYGGATTGLFNGNGSPAAATGLTGVLSQVSKFTTSLGGASADSAGLYVVWAGPNDFLHPTGLPPSVTAMLAVANLSQTVVNLYQLGARDFLLPLMPDLGLTPRLLGAGPATSAQASGLTASFNQLLSSAYGALSDSLPGLSLTLFDTAAAQQALVASGAFTNTTVGCLYDPTGVCPTSPAVAATTMFWDDIHPTAATHLALGQQMAASVPEPSAMLLMAAGVLALLGKAARRASRG